MRRGIPRCVIVTLAGCLLAFAFPPEAAAQQPKPPKEAPGSSRPIHAVLSIRGKALPQEGCTDHGFRIVFEDELEPCDDDPEGVFPARSYISFKESLTFKFDDYTCRPENGTPFSVTHRPGKKPTLSVELFLVGDAGEGQLDRTQTVRVVSFEFPQVRVSNVVGEPSRVTVDAELGPGTLVPPLELTEEDFEQGFNRTYHIPWYSEATGQGTNFGLFEYEQGEATLTLSYKQDTDKPKVEIAGCANLLPGGSKQLTATGTPSGGRYRWSADTPSVLSASGSDSSATVKAGEPGHASVRVEYEARNGKKAEATIEGSVVTLKSVNSGAAIPTLYLYDAYGNEKPATQVPIAQEPPDGTLLEFVPSDPSVVSVENMGSSLLLQGLRPGTTTAQAQTRCGEKTGPVITVKVAGCDPEMIEELHKRYDEVRKELGESISRVNKVITSDKFNEASEKIPGATADLAIEAIDSAAGGAAKLATATKAVKAAKEVISIGSKGWSAARSGTEATALKFAIMATGPIGMAAVSTYEKASAVGNFLKYTDALVDADERIQREQPIQKGYSQELEQIDKLIAKCKQGSGEGGQPRPQPPTAPKPPAQPPKPPSPVPTPTPTQPAGPTTATPTATQPAEPTAPSGGGQTPPPQPPPPPSGSGGGTVGLPLECGCDDSSAAEWRKEDTGLAAIAASLTCLKGHSQSWAQALQTFQGKSDSIAQAMSSLEKALDTPGEKGFEMFRAAVPGLESTAKAWEDITKASETFAAALKGCDKKVPEAASLIRKGAEAMTKSAPELK